MRRLPSLLLNLALALLALGAAGWSVLLVRGGVTTTATAAEAARTVTVAQGTVTASVTADGRLAAAVTASATFETQGTVSAVYATVGQKVATGQLLAKVDPAAAQRDLDLAEANLQAATDALERGSDAQDEVAVAQVAVDNAQAALDGTRLTAPIAGTVTAVNGTVGSSATTDGFVEIADLGNLQVAAQFAEADATRLQPGQPATVTWSALTGAEATGRVLTVDPSATTGTDSTVTYGATISLDRLPEGAKPGQSVEATVTTGTAANVTYVNSAAVTVAGTRYTVTVRRDDGTTETRVVRVGLAGDEAYEITEGLTVGERVVLPEAESNDSVGAERDGMPPGPGGPR